MRITESKLRKIIRKQLLSELNPSIDRMTGGDAESFGKSVSAVGKMTPEELEQSMSNLLNAFADGMPSPKTVIQLLDPTGATSVPDIPPAAEEFEKDPSLINGTLLTLSVLATIPIAGKLAKLGLKGLSKTSKNLKKAKSTGKIPKNSKAEVVKATKAVNDEAASIISKLSATIKSFKGKTFKVAVTADNLPAENFVKLAKVGDDVGALSDIIGKKVAATLGTSGGGEIILYRGIRGKQFNISAMDDADFDKFFELRRRILDDHSKIQNSGFTDDVTDQFSKMFDELESVGRSAGGQAFGMSPDVAATYAVQNIARSQKADMTIVAIKVDMNDALDHMSVQNLPGMGAAGMGQEVMHMPGNLIQDALNTNNLVMIQL